MYHIKFTNIKDMRDHYPSKREKEKEREREREIKFNAALSFIEKHMNIGVSNDLMSWGLCCCPK